MGKALRAVYRALQLAGIDPRVALGSVRGLGPYLRDLSTLKSQQRASQIDFPLGRSFPVLDERFADSGSASGHYFHQDLLVARRIHAANPARHVDVGSRVDGFVAHVASYRPIVVIDIRPQPKAIPNVEFVQADMMAPLAEELVGYCDSLSCLHALEHFGLGRYGDPVNFEGHVVGLSNLTKVVRPGGRFYLSVPIGEQRIEFNAHRVFSVRYLMQLVGNDFRIDAFSYVDDAGDLHENCEMAEASIESNFGCSYGCGILELTKL